MAHAFGIQPSGRREFFVNVRGTEPYVRQPEEGASRVPYNMMITRRETLPAGSGPDQAACGPVQRPLP